MAKHAKKNNIISYDEAKQRKLHEKELQNAKHYREEHYNEEDNYDDFYGDAYNNDAQSNDTIDIGSYDNYQDEPNEKIEENEQRHSFKRRGGKYAEPRQTIPRPLLNVIIVAVLTLVLALISIAMFKSYVVRSINVIGNDEVNYHDITQLCGVDYKQSMLSVKKEDIIESFESQMPMIEVAEVKKIWPNTLEIYVKERPPVCFVVLKGSQKCALIGENNVCLAIYDSYLKGDLPRIYGLNVGSGDLGKELTDGETRKLEVLKLLISAMLETDCISELESININNTTNITMKSVEGTTIKMGDTSSLEIKLANIKVMLKHLKSQNNTDVTMVVTGDNSIYIE